MSKTLTQSIRIPEKKELEKLLSNVECLVILTGAGIEALKKALAK